MQTSAVPKRRSGDADSRLTMYRREIAERAQLLSRLGYAPSRTIARLQANLDWDFELAEQQRPEGLSDKDVTDIVKATYLRRSSR